MYLNLDNPIAQRKTKTVYRDGDKTIKLLSFYNNNKKNIFGKNKNLMKNVELKTVFMSKIISPSINKKMHKKIRSDIGRNNANDLYKTFNKNFNTYKGAIFENIVADMLVKEGYNLYFYRDESGRLEMDFFVRDTKNLIPVEVKASDNASSSLNNLIKSNSYKDIKYGIKLCLNFK